jgi:hypothetical protein
MQERTLGAMLLRFPIPDSRFPDDRVIYSSAASYTAARTEAADA